MKRAHLRSLSVPDASLFLCRGTAFLRGRRWRNGEVWAHRVELFLTDSAHGKQIFDAVKAAALLSHVYDSLRSDWPYTGQFLKFLCVREVEIDWLRGRMLLGKRGHAEHKQRQAAS
jgi:hypothetical protein